MGETPGGTIIGASKFTAPSAPTGNVGAWLTHIGWPPETTGGPAITWFCPHAFSRIPRQNAASKMAAASHLGAR
jgi:hypothetical protein